MKYGARAFMGWVLVAVALAALILTLTAGCGPAHEIIKPDQLHLTWGESSGHIQDPTRTRGFSQSSEFGSGTLVFDLDERGTTELETLRGDPTDDLWQDRLELWESTGDPVRPSKCPGSSEADQELERLSGELSAAQVALYASELDVEHLNEHVAEMEAERSSFLDWIGETAFALLAGWIGYQKFKPGQPKPQPETD